MVTHRSRDSFPSDSDIRSVGTVKVRGPALGLEPKPPMAMTVVSGAQMISLTVLTEEGGLGL